jgi:hypothetical protein
VNNTATQAMRLLAELFPQYRPTSEESTLWADNLGQFHPQDANAAIRQHRTSHSWPTPDLAKVLELARVKSVDRDVTDNPKASEWAAHAERCRQDDEAAIGWLESLPRVELEALADKTRRILNGAFDIPKPFRVAGSSMMARGFMVAASKVRP